MRACQKLTTGKDEKKMSDRDPRHCATKDAKSITHKHILSIINTRLSALPTDMPIRILDAGCGNCELLSYLETYVPIFNKDLDIEIYGFDVTDSKVQFNDYFEKAVQMLSNRHKYINWKTRLRSIKSTEIWPFDDEFFNIVVSNQVVEHVHDHDFFFSQNWRVLKENGFSIHLFPVKNYILEGHLNLPFVHRFKQWRFLYSYIRFLSALRIGKWKHLKNRCSLDDYSESYADFLTHYCNYVSIGELLNFGKKCGFRAGFNYTGNFYYEKLKELFRFRHRFKYPRENTHLFSIHIFKYIQCITFFLEKHHSYVNYIAKYRSD